MALAQGAHGGRAVETPAPRAAAPGDGNFLRPIVGVEDFDSDILGIVKAGTSTGLGFCAFQSVQNVTFAQGSAWIDP